MHQPSSSFGCLTAFKINHTAVLEPHRLVSQTSYMLHITTLKPAQWIFCLSLAAKVCKPRLWFNKSLECSSLMLINIICPICMNSCGKELKSKILLFIWKSQKPMLSASVKNVKWIILIKSVGCTANPHPHLCTVALQCHPKPITLTETKCCILLMNGMADNWNWDLCTCSAVYVWMYMFLFVLCLSLEVG